MKTQFAAVAAFAGAAVASLDPYGTTSSPEPPVYGGETTSAPGPATTYACNPAHQYPEGVVCTTIGGSLTLIIPTSSTTCTEEMESTSVPAYPVTTPEGSVTVPGYPVTTPEGSVTVPGYPVTTPEGSVTVPGYPVTTSPVVTVVESTTWSKETVSTESATVPSYPAHSTSSVPEVPVYSASSSVPVPEHSASSSVPVPVYSTPVVPGYPESSSHPGWSTTESVTVPAYPATTAVQCHECTTGFTTAPSPSGTPGKPYPYGNITTSASGPKSVPSSTSPVAYTGAASKMVGGAFLGLAGAIAAFFL